MIRHHRGNRRHQDDLKAKRKQNIVHELGDYWHYDHFGQYRKGKIHCSCPMCAGKTNAKINKSGGPVSSDARRKGCRLSVTNDRCGKKHWKHSDRIKVEKMAMEIWDYEEGKDAD